MLFSRSSNIKLTILIVIIISEDFIIIKPGRFFKNAFLTIIEITCYILTSKLRCYRYCQMNDYFNCDQECILYTNICRKHYWALLQEWLQGPAKIKQFSSSFWKNSMKCIVCPKRVNNI